jgi:hypothetical protein
MPASLGRLPVARADDLHRPVVCIRNLRSRFVVPVGKLQLYISICDPPLETLRCLLASRYFQIHCTRVSVIARSWSTDQVRLNQFCYQDRDPDESSSRNRSEGNGSRCARRNVPTPAAGWSSQPSDRIRGVVLPRLWPSGIGSRVPVSGWTRRMQLPESQRRTIMLSQGVQIPLLHECRRSKIANRTALSPYVQVL